MSGITTTNIMATQSEKKAEPQQQVPDPKAIHVKHLETQQRKAEAKLKRIDSWPKEHQEVARQRTQSKLNQIREEKSKLAK